MLRGVQLLKEVRLRDRVSGSPEPDHDSGQLPVELLHEVRGLIEHDAVVLAVRGNCQQVIATPDAATANRYLARRVHDVSTLARIRDLPAE